MITSYFDYSDGFVVINYDWLVRKPKEPFPLQKRYTRVMKNSKKNKNNSYLLWYYKLYLHSSQTDRINNDKSHASISTQYQVWFFNGVFITLSYRFYCSYIIVCNYSNHKNKNELMCFGK